jgi:ribosomal protein S18 acetylase RimI-like enzyme
MLEIRPVSGCDEEQVIALWQRCGLVRPWNDPRKDIARKRGEHPELFLVALADGRLVGCVMAGYDGYRGRMNYLAVDPDHQRAGIVRSIVEAAEERLRALGCVKVNLQLRRDNLEAAEFYTHLGYREDDVVSFGKRLLGDPPESSDSTS